MCLNHLLTPKAPKSGQLVERQAIMTRIQIDSHRILMPRGPSIDPKPPFGFALWNSGTRTSFA